MDQKNALAVACPNRLTLRCTRGTRTLNPIQKSHPKPNSVEVAAGAAAADIICKDRLYTLSTGVTTDSQSAQSLSEDLSSALSGLKLKCNKVCPNRKLRIVQINAPK